VGGRRPGEGRAERSSRPTPRRRTGPRPRGAEGGPQPPDRGPAPRTRRGAPSSPGRATPGAHRRRPVVAGPRPGLRPAQRPTDRAHIRLALVEGPPARSGRARGPAARRAAHGGHAATQKACTPGRHGGPGPRTEAHDDGHLQPCDARPRPRHRKPHGKRCGIDLAPHPAPVATTLAPETTQAALLWENALVDGVELRGLEPLTPTLPGRRDRVRRHPPTFATTPPAADLPGSETAADEGEQP
jgi:hypothetical protein